MKAERIHSDRIVRAIEREVRLAAIEDGVRPIAAAINELAGKCGVAPSTIAKHALLLPVPIPALPEWNERIAA
jgi:hypothetical protein